MTPMRFAWTKYAETSSRVMNADAKGTQDQHVAFLNGAAAMFNLILHLVQNTGSIPVDGIRTELQQMLATESLVVRVRRSIVPLGHIEITGQDNTYRVVVPSNEELREKLGKDTEAYFNAWWSGKSWNLLDRVNVPEGERW